jgi:radical SAM protein with 4Fe4S-binding SPASM domain
MSAVNKDQIIISSWTETLKYHYKRGKGHLPRYALNRIRWHSDPKFKTTRKYPEHIDLELSSACNMKCPMCYTITPEFKDKVSRKTMEWETIKKVLDEIGGKVFSIRLSLRGEPTLHKDFLKVMKYAKEVGIKEVSTLTNALKLNEAMMRAMIEAKLDWLTISVDGIGETYNHIRKPAKFDDLLAKLKRFQELKKEMNSEKPVIKVQSVWPAIKDNPQAYFDTFKGLVDQVASNQLVDYLGKDAVIDYKKDFSCPAIYQRLIIGSDGLALMCHNDLFNEHPVGNVYDHTIAELWNGAGMTKARDSHAKCNGVKDYEACKRCYLPRALEEVEFTSIENRKVLVNQYKGRVQEVGL